MEGTYRYDGSYAGFLTLMARLLSRRILPDAILVEPPCQVSLFDPPTLIATDGDLALRLEEELQKRLTSEPVHLVRRAFLADRPGREMLICRYLLLAWEKGSRVAGMLAHPDVAPVWKLARQVGQEAHRYLGFVRFQETKEGFYYAAISPDHRVLPLIAPHFADRFRDQHWVIHDRKHNEGIVHDRERGKYVIIPMESAGEPDPTPGEERFQGWWRAYFATLAIVERENLKLQRSKVPLKVRPWLTEFRY